MTSIFKQEKRIGALADEDRYYLCNIWTMMEIALRRCQEIRAGGTNFQGEGFSLGIIGK